ncbi:hypothetical protein D1872_297060 [compost metagenome]
MTSAVSSPASPSANLVAALTSEKANDLAARNPSSEADDVGAIAAKTCGIFIGSAVEYPYDAAI